MTSGFCQWGIPSQTPFADAPDAISVFLRFATSQVRWKKLTSFECLISK